MLVRVSRYNCTEFYPGRVRPEGLCHCYEVTYDTVTLFFPIEGASLFAPLRHFSPKEGVRRLPAAMEAAEVFNGLTSLVLGHVGEVR